MPVSGRSDYRQVQFRKRQEQEISSGLRFWQVFAAVLLALFVHSAVINVLTWWAVRDEVAQMRADMAQMDRELAEALAEPVPSIFAADRPPAARPAPVAAAVPALPGTIRAREQGLDRACINGRIYRRLPNGWDHIGGRCRATSQ